MIKRLIYSFLCFALFGNLAKAQTYTVNFTPSGSEAIDVNITSANGDETDGSNQVIKVGQNTASEFKRALLKFNMGSLTPGIEIISATLRLKGLNHNVSNPAEGRLQLIVDPWTNETASWNTTSFFKNSEIPNILISAPASSTENYQLDVKDMVQKMVNTPLVNFGWLLYMDIEDGGQNTGFEFGSSDNDDAALRPTLEIVYCNKLSVKAYVNSTSNESSEDGGVHLVVSGGVAPYTYLWSNDSTTSDLSNVPPGVYSVLITDNRGATKQTLVPLTTHCGSNTFTLQPTAQAFKSALLKKEALNENSANSNYAVAESLQASCDGGREGYAVKRTMFAFDVNALPDNIQVDAATLILTGDGTPTNGETMVQLCPVQNNTWDEKSATYNLFGKDYDDPTAAPIEFEYNETQITYTFDVLSYMQSAIANNTTDNGWLLKIKNDNETPEKGRIASFSSSSGQDNTAWPKLVIELTSAHYACDDNALNWELEETYDEKGQVIASKKTYMDNLGRTTQRLFKNPSNEVFTTSNIYDSYGRPGLSTMPAYTGDALKYNIAFMNNIYGQEYSYLDFDASNTLNNNTALQTTLKGTLGYYYSDYNTYDAYQATAQNPYSKITYNADPASGQKAVNKPGNEFKPGTGRQDYSFSMVSGTELKYVFGATGSNYYSYKAARNSTNRLDCTPITVSQPPIATKQIEISPDNIETITYRVGDKVIATCYSGISPGQVCSNIISVENTMYYRGTQSTDIHLPDADKNSLYLPLPLNYLSLLMTNYIDYKIVDLYTDEQLVQGTDFTFGYYREVLFTPAFLAKYTGRSLMLRISFLYNPVYSSYLESVNITPADAKVVYNLSYGRFSKNYYDLGNQLRKSVSPKGFNCVYPNTIGMATTYDYSHFGQLVATKSPDEGLVEYVYNKQGNLRFKQNSEQKANSRFSYVNYDKHGRVFETGEYQSVVNSVTAWFFNYYGDWPLNYPTSPAGLPSTSIVDSLNGLSATHKAHVTYTGYRPPAPANDIPAGYSYYSSYRNFRNGLVNFIKNENSTTWYNYDRVGRSLATITQVTDADFVAKNPGINNQVKTVEQTYDYFTGQALTSTCQQHNTNEYIKYQYAYNVNYQPSTTQITFGSHAPEMLTSNYYNKMGRLNRVVLGNNYQGVDYVYTLLGALKAINHPALSNSYDPGADNGNYSGSTSAVNKDLFGEIVEYYNGDFLRTGRNILPGISAANSKYNGLIYATRFKTRDDVNGNSTRANYIDFGGSAQAQVINPSSNYHRQELRFTYAYDEFNQLNETTFGTYDNFFNSFSPRSDYKEQNMNYDANGNLQSLKRNAYVSGGSPVILDDLTYTNGTNTNQLANIVDAASNSFAQSFNFKTPNTNAPSAFVYNSIGQLTASDAEGISTITYYPSGKINTITFTNGNTCQYTYAADGSKLKSKLYDATYNRYKYTWYIGVYIYEYDETASAGPVFNLVEAKVPTGIIRVNNSSNINNGYLVYHLTDHIGHVRVSFKGSNPGTNAIDVLSWNDYYAFGGQLPGRIWKTEDYRYANRGSEKAADGTNWDQFALRSLNHDLGRWFAPDPYSQFNSPYLAMANNPISHVDPDGGWVNAAPGFGRRFLGAEAQKLRREYRIEEFSAQEVYKRYLEEYAHIRKWMLDANDEGVIDYVRVFGMSNERIVAYLRAVQSLNITYTGFDRYNEGPVVGMTNGMNNLPANAAGNCMLEVLATNNTVQGGFANYHGAWETEVTDRGQNHIAEMQGRMGHGFDSFCIKTALMSKLKGESDAEGTQVGTVYRTFEGNTETVKTYNMSGELVSTIVKTSGNMVETYNNQAYTHVEATYAPTQVNSVNITNQGGGSDWANTTANGLSAFAFANEGKNVLVDYAAKAGNMGDDAVKYLKISKGISTTAGAAGVLVTIADGLTSKQGWQNHHTADLLIGAGSVFLLSGPWGWAIGGAYFLTDLAVQSYTGKSITENLFDPTPTLNSNKR